MTSLNLQVLAEGVSGCRRCDLRSDFVPVVGEGETDRPLAVVMGRPTADDALLGRPFECRGGRRLRHLLKGRVYWTAAVRCRGHTLTGHVSACRPWLGDELRLVKPRAVLAMGPVAARSLYVRPKPPPAGSVEAVPGLGVPGAVWWDVDRLRTAGSKLEGELLALVDRLEATCSASC